MPVTVLCLGKLRERFYADAAAEYGKRLSRLMPVTIVELPDEKEPDNPSPALCRQVIEKEGERILSKISAGDHVIALCVEAPQPASE